VAFQKEQLFIWNVKL